MTDTQLEYYEGLLDYLDDCVPCLADLIAQYDAQLEGL